MSTLIDELREECGYDPDDLEGSTESLIDYKDALEDRLSSVLAESVELAGRLRRAKSAISYALGRRSRARKRCRIYTDPGSVIRELRGFMDTEKARKP